MSPVRDFDFWHFAIAQANRGTFGFRHSFACLSIFWIAGNKKHPLYPLKKFHLSLRSPLIGAVLWVMLVGVGMALMFGYANNPGGEGQPPDHWPAATQISRNSGQPTLLMFAHPKCPCTRASLEELGQVLNVFGSSIRGQVWFIKPDGASGDWTNTSLYRQALSIPGVSVHCDEGGVEAARFHAETSGQTVLYDGSGKLLFHGGITLSRGHAGDNPAREELVRLLAEGSVSPLRTRVYGCPLFGKCSLTNAPANDK